MQKQPFFGQYIEIPLTEDPLYFFPYTQRYKTKRNMHYHNGLEIGLCLRGEGVFFVEDRLFPFGKGDVSVVLPGERHIAQSPDQNPSEWYFLTIDPQALGLVFPEHLARPVLSARGVTYLMRMLCAELENRRKDTPELAVVLLQALCIWLRRDNENADDEPVDDRAAEAILPALSYISQHYMEDITVDQLSEMCFLSTTYFRRVFKRCTRLSPMAYLCQVRLKMAAVLLRSSGAPVSEIIDKTGFRTASSFNRKFREYYHMSPREWRQSL